MPLPQVLVEVTVIVTTILYSSIHRGKERGKFTAVLKWNFSHLISVCHNWYASEYNILCSFYKIQVSLGVWVNILFFHYTSISPVVCTASLASYISVKYQGTSLTNLLVQEACPWKKKRLANFFSAQFGWRILKGPMSFLRFCFRVNAAMIATLLILHEIGCMDDKLIHAAKYVRLYKTLPKIL